MNGLSENRENMTEENRKNSLFASGKPHLDQDPGELSEFVQVLLQQLQGKFEDMSSQIMSKMDEMGARIDELEKSIGDIMDKNEVQLTNTTNFTDAPSSSPKKQHQ